MVVYFITDRLDKIYWEGLSCLDFFLCVPSAKIGGQNEAGEDLYVIVFNLVMSKHGNFCNL